MHNILSPSLFSLFIFRCSFMVFPPQQIHSTFLHSCAALLPFCSFFMPLDCFKSVPFREWEWWCSMFGVFIENINPSWSQMMLMMIDDNFPWKPRGFRPRAPCSHVSSCLCLGSTPYRYQSDNDWTFLLTFLYVMPFTYNQFYNPPGNSHSLIPVFPRYFNLFSPPTEHFHKLGFSNLCASVPPTPQGLFLLSSQPRPNISQQKMSPRTLCSFAPFPLQFNSFPTPQPQWECLPPGFSP